MSRSKAAWLAVASTLVLSSPALAQNSTIRDQADVKAAALVKQMTIDEKVGQLVNVAPAIPRLQIPAYNWWTESLHGALGAVRTTNFPEPIGLAASFDAPMVHDVASAISVEVRALHTLGRETGHLGHIGTGLDTWSPNINIFRDPRWGRGQETYGEDPYLTARMGVSFVTGMQGDNPDLPNVISTPKHFAVHSGPESTRHVADVFVSPHDLEDTYLPAFRAAIVEAKAGSIMCAYNRIDGQPACANDLLLKDHLRGAWGFQGYVVSDCDAVKDIANSHKYAPDGATAVAAAMKTGTDNECNGDTLSDTPGLGDRYKEALTRGLISEDDIDRALTRLFSARYRTGDLPGIADKTAIPVTQINTPEHQALALKAAIESMVLLKNDGVLPLKAGTRIAVIGPLGDATRVLRGNYSSAASAPPISVIDGLRAAMPKAQIDLVPFSKSITDGDLVPDSAFVSPSGKPGLQADYYNANASGAYDAKPVTTRLEVNVVSEADELKQVADHHKIVWSGFLVAPESGTYRLAVTGVKGRIETGGTGVESTVYSHWAQPLKLVDVTLTKGERYPLHLETETGVSATPAVFWKRVTNSLDADVMAAVAKADVVVAAVGLTSDLEGEEMPVKVEGFSGGDKTSLDLPADQRRLLEAAKALGKPLVVVLMNGSAIDLSWEKDNASAILEAWYPGQSGGRAVADVLTGAADPGGRLPLTFYRSISDLPPFDDYSMKGRTYRYYAGTPVYPFGYGLSYTHFKYGSVSAVGTPDKGIQVTTQVTNDGQRDGNEVAELYITPPSFDGAPHLALRGFSRIELKRGATRTVTFTLSPRDLSFVAADGARMLVPGQYHVWVGSGQPGSEQSTQSADYMVTSPTTLPE